MALFLTWQGIQLKTLHTQDEHANHDTTKGVLFGLKFDVLLDIELSMKNKKNLVNEPFLTYNYKESSASQINITCSVSSSTVRLLFVHESVLDSGPVSSWSFSWKHIKWRNLDGVFPFDFNHSSSLFL